MTAKLIKFQKYQGAGNDFIMLDNRANEYSNLETAEIAFLCDRHFGIGADGLIMLDSSTDSHFHMRYFNSDGKESTMCGNGGRCIVLFAYHLGLFEKKTWFTAVDGQHEAEIISNNIIRLKMSDCQFPAKITDNIFAIDTGSPHLVIFTSKIEDIDVRSEGKKWRYNEKISINGMNVNFCEIENDEIRIRTYERGVEDETLACGTGCVAAAITAVYGKKFQAKHPIKLRALGGVLCVDFVQDENVHSIFLTGEAKKVFNGIAEII